MRRTSTMTIIYFTETKTKDGVNGIRRLAGRY
jgi:hypothetical protein